MYIFLSMKPAHHLSPLQLINLICVLLLTFILCVMTLPSLGAFPASQIPLKEISSKKPIRLDSAFKSKAVKVKVRRRGGISSMTRYNYDEYTTEKAKHKAIMRREQEYGFLVYAGKSYSKTSFSYMLTDHINDTAWVNSAVALNTEYTRAYIYFDKSQLDLEIIKQSKDIYSSNLRFNNDTSKWEIIVMDRMRFKESIQPVIIGEVTNQERRLQIRLVAVFENGDKAQFAPPGFEVIEDGTTLMAVQFLGYEGVVPVIWIDSGLDHHTRFILITAASSLIGRLIDVINMVDN